jgi:phage terminase small subunit
MGKAKHPHNSSRPEPKAVLRALEAEDMEMLKLALTPRQRAFAVEYVVDFDATASAIRAGYSPSYADRQGYLLTRHKGIAAYIAHLISSKEAKITAISPDYVIAGLTKILSTEGTRTADQIRVYEILARHLGMFVDKTEITGKDGGAIEIERRAVEQEANDFAHLINNMNRKETKKEIVLQ